ncbi:sigma factor-like helix-turn-helix DNA-binding protein [Paenibacillus rigui]|uniref:RNA polymerase subunit sigma n=1 Tax=Paenibacillus rigui TaxID=554312 RepID=A0A229USG4_9BACL|nr:sigma factor-like helix-turn-helix DNA-binding protein [Paenibacillus rigui]OXM86466.1 RNA polymerase subunit sigma [Paenibacillus rigui]
MGKIIIDLDKGAREYTRKYAVIDAKGIALLLRDGHHIRSRTYYPGDYAGIDILTDLHQAMSVASLTPRQSESIAWVYGCDLTLDTAGVLMGITKQAVKQAICCATEKIAAVFRHWGELENRMEECKAGDRHEL